MRQVVKSGVGLALAASLLSGCMATEGGQGLVSRFKSPDATKVDAAKGDATKAKATTGAKAMRATKSDNSEIITALQQRRSVLPAGSSYAKVADSVLSSNTRSAEAELRSARLRAEAQSKNWLPSIGPSISLNSLGEFVTSLIVEQVIFDNGRKKAERAFAKADVEVAAVGLAEDTNARVYDALALYLTAEEGRAKVRLADVAIKDLKHFEWVMDERVKGGISDMSDLNITRHKLAEMQSSRAAASEQSVAALAELGAMTALPLGNVHGLTKVSLRNEEPLLVVRAQAEKEREVAGAVIERANHLPGIKASGNVAKGGGGITLNSTSDNLLGLGTGASLKAIEATRQAAELRISEAREEADRARRGKEQQLSALDRQAAEAQTLTTQAKANLDLFQLQYEAGQRQIMDVVGVYESFARAQQSQAALKYQAAKLRLEIARDLGLLADGDRI